jgi:hypothetical protein
VCVGRGARKAVRCVSPASPCSLSLLRSTAIATRHYSSRLSRMPALFSHPTTASAWGAAGGRLWKRLCMCSCCSALSSELPSAIQMLENVRPLAICCFVLGRHLTLQQQAMCNICTEQ